MSSITHLRLHNLLKEAFSPEAPEIPLTSDLTLFSVPTVSDGAKGRDQAPSTPPEDLLRRLPPGTDLSDLFAKPDSAILENSHFRHFVVAPQGVAKSLKAIILLHGLNERFWDKYLPIAARLARNTGKSVILFPTAFHMNRSPGLWTNPKTTRAISQWRKSLYPGIEECSLSNVAISIRFQEDPSRFFWSGLETYENILSLTRQIRDGNHPCFAQGASIDFFTYSIGCYIGEHLLIANEDGLFDDSRLALFCGGPVFEGMRAISKFIIDSEANSSLVKLFLDDLGQYRQRDPRLDECLGSTRIGQTFLSMLKLELGRDFRESRLRALSRQIKALALEKDEVIRPAEVFGTLKGKHGDIDIDVSVASPDYPYRHEDPFPTLPKHEAQVDEWFRRLIDELSDFLK
ncbi:MAG: DUF6051 family protein [Deltaproteobacteria bacterium]|jgi:hypothetical protein|nr:DUF6051 family protein [Deltaproteobacteria bacterium]